MPEFIETDCTITGPNGQTATAGGASLVNCSDGPRTTTFDAGRLCTTLAEVYAEVDRLNGPARRIDWPSLNQE